MKRLPILIPLLCTIAGKTFAQSEVQFDRIVHDFGLVDVQKGMVQTTFSFKNNGTSPIVLIDQNTSCGCTSVSFQSDSVQPGQDGSMAFFFDPANKGGSFTKSVELTFASRNYEFRKFLNVKGIVVAKPDTIVELEWGSQYVQAKSRKLKLKSEEYLDFENELARMAMLNGYIRLQLTVSNPDSTLARKRLNEIEDQLSNKLEEVGLDSSNLEIRKVCEVTNSDNLLIQQFEEYKRLKYKKPEEEYALEIDSILKAQAALDSAKFLQNDLECYYAFFKNGQDTISFQDAFFKRFVNEIAAKINSGSKIKFLVVSAASNEPSPNDYSKLETAQIRAVNALDYLFEKFNPKLKDSAGYGFFRPISIIRGPEFDDSTFAPNLYSRFEFLKIIPIYEQDIPIAQINIQPFYQEFATNDEKLNSESPNFVGLVSQLAQGIKKMGYVQVSIESSTSTIPATGEISNKILAYNKSQALRNKIIVALLDLGLDPNRLVVTKEELLEQGHQSLKVV